MEEIGVLVSMLSIIAIIFQMSSNKKGNVKLPLNCENRNILVCLSKQAIVFFLIIQDIYCCTNLIVIIE